MGHLARGGARRPRRSQALPENPARSDTADRRHPFGRGIAASAGFFAAVEAEDPALAPVRRNGIRKACSTIGRAVWAVRQIGVSRCSNASRRTTEARGRLSGGVYAPPNRSPRATASRVCCFAPRVPPMHFSRYRRGKRGSSQTPEGKNIPFRRFSGSGRKTSLVREQEHRRTAQRCLFGPGAPGSAVSRTAFRTPMIPRTASCDRPVLPANVPFPARIPIASSESIRGRRVVSG